MCVADPKRAGDQVKTDRRHSMSLARVDARGHQAFAAASQALRMFCGAMAGSHGVVRPEPVDDRHRALTIAAGPQSPEARPSSKVTSTCQYFTMRSSCRVRSVNLFGRRPRCWQYRASGTNTEQNGRAQTGPAPGIGASNMKRGLQAQANQ
jgi:hypothetical protein